jgi:hypothetical protein
MDTNRGKRYSIGSRSRRKKLIEAARYLLTGGASAVEASWSDLKKFGVTDDEIKRLQGEDQKPDRVPEFTLWPENWRAIQLLDAMSTQWRSLVGTSSILWLGMDYTALDAVEKRIVKHPEAEDPEPSVLFNQLRMVEQIAIQIKNKV